MNELDVIEELNGDVFRKHGANELNTVWWLSLFWQIIKLLT